jgi:hypothetical protein
MRGLLHLVVPALFVFDGTTLTPQRRLGCPGPGGNRNFRRAGLAVDTRTGRLHVASPGNPITVVTDDRPP